MVSFILSGHGDFAPGVASALAMVAGHVEELHVVPFAIDEAGEYPAKLQSAIEDALKCTSECVVFCDLKGGTPFNVAMLVAAQDPRVQVVCGTNLPMLIETVFYRKSFGMAGAQKLIEVACAAGRDAIEAVDASSVVRHDNSADEDGI